ncbi:MAG TPA: bifunctional phosphoribosylaminoimidazolecarboxamide formyltransferase/IMP cyclohydrolase [Stellaceae bacterium]
MANDAPRPIGRALLSVHDKTGIVELARVLAARGIALISSGGTAGVLREAGLTVAEVAEVTRFPEMLDGRVKTLHPAIHGGLLARRDRPDHLGAIAAHGIAPIDLLVVNLYPFAATVARGASFDECVENIDIGGPALIRAAAKNHADVAVITDSGDYAALLESLRDHDGATPLALRRALAAKAFARTAAYDAAIAGWLAAREGDSFPATLTLTATRRQMLRYGENPHQRAAFYVDASGTGLGAARQLQGKELSYNNLNDTDAAYALAAEFASPAVVIVKHANPCGVAVADNVRAAWDRALACDPASAYGGIVAVNRSIDRPLAQALDKHFAEVVIAPAIAPEAEPILARKKNWRLLVAPLPDPAAAGMTLRSLAGGYLLQHRDAGRVTETDLRAVTKRAPTAQEIADLLFAFTVAKHVKSNAIVYAKGGATVGIGAGQMSRVDSSHLAARKAGDRAIGSVVASDAFFPFADGLEAAIAAGATAAIQPGGSTRDAEVIAAADRAGIAMVFTGMRHFRH